MTDLRVNTPPEPLYIDLHIHSTASDGSLSPREIIKAAEKVPLRAMAITDHDTTDGSAEALQHSKSTDVEILSGVEISAEFELGAMHLLGYLFRLDDVNLTQILEIVQKSRAERNLQIIQRLQDLGIDISYDEVSEVSGGGQVGRPRIAEVLVALLGHADRWSFLERRVLAGAVEYFVQADDDDRDFASDHGLEDDARVVAAVCEALGRPDLAGLIR